MADFDIKKIAIYEPRLKVANEREWVIVKGGQTVTTTGYPASSFSEKQMNFTTNPPGKKNVLDRHVILKVPVQLTFTGPGSANPTDLMIQQGRDAFRSFPISSILSTLTCRINGFPVTIETNQFVHVLENFHNKIDSLNTYQSLYPNMADNFQNYSDAEIGNRNPLGSYSDDSSIIPRGAYNMTVTNNTNTGAVVTADIYEPIVLPPFLFDDSQSGGLTNLDTLSFNFTFSSNLWRIWSRSTANTVPITTLNVKIGVGANASATPTLLLNWITPRDTQNIPDRVRYPYFQLSRYVQSANQNVVAPNAQITISSQVIQLNSIPRKLYIFAKESDSIIDQSINNSVNITDTFMSIKRISLSWDNLDGVLAGSDAINLYEMSVANGLNYDWTSWSGLTTNYGTSTTTPGVGKIGLKGSIICLCPGVDFGLRNSQAEGVLDKINLQVTVDAVNVNQTKDVNPDLYVLAVYDGFLDIYNNSAQAIIGAVSNADVLSIPVSNDISYHELQKIYGGDFFSKVRDTGSKLVKGLSKANDYLRDTKLVSNVLGAIPTPYTQSASSIARTLGYGYGGVLMGGGEGGCMDCNGSCGGMDGGGDGGAMIPRNKLMRRLGRR